MQLGAAETKDLKNRYDEKNDDDDDAVEYDTYRTRDAKANHTSRHAHRLSLLCTSVSSCALSSSSSHCCVTRLKSTCARRKLCELPEERVNMRSALSSWRAPLFAQAQEQA